MHTTDPQDELFDVLNSDGTPAGYAKPRGAIHRDGDWHRSLHIWFFRRNGDSLQVLFQRRSLTKDTWPGALDVTVGGHFRAGETLNETVREASEELGVEIRPDELTRIGRRSAIDPSGRWNDRELNEVFAVQVDLPLTSYRLHPEEVDSIVAVEINDAMTLFEHPTEQVTAYEAHRGPDGRAKEPVEMSLMRAAFVEMNDAYALETLTRIIQIVNGETFEPFLIEVPPGEAGGA